MGRGLLLWLLGRSVADYSSGLVARRSARLIARAHSMSLKHAISRLD